MRNILVIFASFEEYKKRCPKNTKEKNPSTKSLEIFDTESSEIGVAEEGMN